MIVSSTGTIRYVGFSDVSIYPHSARGNVREPHSNETLMSSAVTHNRSEIGAATKDGKATASDATQLIAATDVHLLMTRGEAEGKLLPAIGLPNLETRAAIEELEGCQGKQYGSVEVLLEGAGNAGSLDT